MGTVGVHRFGRMRMLWAAGVIAAVVCVPACSTGGGAAPGAPSSPPLPSSTSGSGPTVPSTASQALLLVPAIWRVRDAAGESSTTWIRFDSGIELIRPKGDVDFSWSTQRDRLLTHVDAWSSTLGTRPPTAPWLTSTTRFTRDGDGWVLEDARGRREARLVRDGVPPPSTQADHSVPKIDRIIRAQHEDAVPGASVQPVVPSAAVGIWGLDGIAVADGSVTLSADGTWTGRTSCRMLGVNEGGGGAYRLLPTGALLVTEGAVGGTGCSAPGHAPPSDAKAIVRFSEAGSVTIHGSAMTVFDRRGTRLGTLQRKG